MSVNTLTYEQIASVLNDIISNATGTSITTGALGASVGDMISVAQTALATNRDAIYNALGNVIGQTIFAVRPYGAKFAGLEKNLTQWGGYMRKLSIANTDWADDEAYAYPVLYDASQEPADGLGKVIDQWKIKKSNVLQTNFYGQSIYGDHLTIMEDQLETAFQSPDQLGSFLTLITTDLSNRLEMSRDAIARGLLINMIGTLYHEAATTNKKERVVHLLTEYNALTGLSLTNETVYQPENFAPFMKWVYSRIASITDIMTENSTMYQTVIDGKPVLRHTPYQNQKVYLYAPARHQIDARVIADTYHDNYLRYSDVETVNFWQYIKNTPITDAGQNVSIGPDGVYGSIAYTKSDGTIQNVAGVNVNNIFGLIFDEDAMGYALLDRRTITTPVNASGLYRNLWVHCKQRVFMDNTEKAVLLLLD